MATILRSSKYIRCLNGFARRIAVADDKSNLITKCIAVRAQCIDSYSTKNYATAAATQRKDIPVNYVNIFNTLDFKVQRYGRVFYPEVEDVLSKIRETGYIPSLDALLLIRCCGDLMVDTTLEQRNNMVQEIWSTLNTLNIPMDISHFNALLRVYLENGHKFSPIDFLTNLKEKGIEPNRVTYQRLIMHYCNNGDIEGATKILEFMRDKEIPLTEGVFNALITGHSEANDMESAKNILNIMKEVDVEPSASTYTALLRAYAKRGDMESIKSCLKEASSEDITLQDKDFLEIIHALAANDHTDAVDEILSIIPFGPSYNVEAAHAILKILDVGNVDVALKILRTMQRRKRNGMEEEETDAESESGTFLIRKLVNSKYPTEKIVKACMELEQRGHHTRALNVATERALANGNVELAVELLRAWKEHGATIREHYFWPIIVAHGKASNYQGIYDTLQLMVNEFNLTPSFETIKDYVLPYTVGKWDETVKTMKDFYIPHTTIISAIANRMLMDRKIRKTANFMTNYRVDYQAEPFYRPLAEALCNTGDAKSFVVILRLLYDAAARMYAHNDNNMAVPPEEVIDIALRLMLDFVPVEKAPYVDDVLTHLVEAGLSISPELGDDIRKYFQEHATPEIDAKIVKLTSGTLELTPHAEFNTYGGANGPDESGSLDKRELGNDFTAKRRQLAFALRTGDIDVVKTLVQDLESLNFDFSPALCAQLVEVACKAEDLEMADKWVARLRNEHPNETLDIQKVTKYAGLLIAKDRFDDALRIILEQPRTENPEDYPLSVKRMVKQLLDTAAERGNVEKTKQLFEALIETKYSTADNFMLGPLVKVHLNRNDLEGALSAFEKACITYQCTPLKNELSKKFIDAEDANSLQRLTDLSTQIHGESNSLIDLVLSFLECGRARQAKKILETPGLRVRAKKLKACAERYLAEDKTECLTQFIDLTKHLQIVDRQELYDVFLEAYCKVNDWQPALSLWTEMQDENVQPNETFLSSLASLLKRNNQPVPFVYKDDKVGDPTPPERAYVTRFKEALINGDLAEAESTLANVAPTDVNLSTMVSNLSEEYSKRQNVHKACQLLDTLLFKYGRQPRASALKALWNTMIEAKEFEKLRTHGKSLSKTTKNKLRFQKYLNRANLREHGVEKCLDDLASNLTDSKEDNLKLIMNTVHFTTYMKELKKNPNAVEKFKPVAEKLAEQNIYLPMNMMWCYYFEANKPEADELWSRYLNDSNWIVFNYLVDQSRVENNVDLLERLNEKVWKSEALSKNAQIAVSSNLIDMYIANNRIDDAVEMLKRNRQIDIDYLKMNHPKIHRALFDGLEKSGKSFPSELQDTRQKTEAVSNESNESRNVSTVE